MDARRKLGSLFLSVGGVAALAVALLAVALSNAGIAGNPLTTYAVLAVAIVGAAIFALWQLVDRSLLRGLNALAGEARVIAHGTRNGPRAARPLCRSHPPAPGNQRVGGEAGAREVGHRPRGRILHRRGRGAEKPPFNPAARSA